MAAEKQKLADAEAARVHAAELEAARKEAEERTRVETEARLKREAEELAAREAEEKRLAEIERQRIEAMRPDVEKVHLFGKSLRDIGFPVVSSDEAHDFCVGLVKRIHELADECEQFAA